MSSLGQSKGWTTWMWLGGAAGVCIHSIFRSYRAVITFLSETVRVLVLEIENIWGSMAELLLSIHTKASRQDVFQILLKATGHTQ